LLHSVFEALEHTEPSLRAELLDRAPPLALLHPRDDGLAPIDYTDESALAERIAMMQMHSQQTRSRGSRVAFTADASRWLNRDLANVEDYMGSEIAVICQGLEDDISKQKTHVDPAGPHPKPCSVATEVSGQYHRCFTVTIVIWI
jgi:hypothetical protein